MIASLLVTNATLVISYALGLGPLEVRYPSTADDAVKTNRASISFRDDPKTEPVERNYWYSGFDRGHLAPAADFAAPDCRETLEATYLMSNISPMYPKFNRGRWANIEAYAREVVKHYGAAKLVTIPVYGETTNRCGRLTVPTAFLKIAYTGDVCVAAWLADHVPDEQKTKGTKTK